MGLKWNVIISGIFAILLLTIASAFEGVIDDYEISSLVIDQEFNSTCDKIVEIKYVDKKLINSVYEDIRSDLEEYVTGEGNFIYWPASDGVVTTFKVSNENVKNVESILSDISASNGVLIKNTEKKNKEEVTLYYVSIEYKRNIILNFLLNIPLRVYLYTVFIIIWFIVSFPFLVDVGQELTHNVEEYIERYENSKN